MTYTYLAHFRAHKLLAIGPYQCSLDLLKKDIHKIWLSYEKEAKELTLPEFYRIWSGAHASLLHYACPPNYGRTEFMNVIYALFLEYFSRSTDPPLLPEVFPTEQDRKHHFALYSVYILYLTTPTFARRVPFEFELPFLEIVMSYVLASPLFDLKYTLSQLLELGSVVAWDTHPSTWCHNLNGSFARLLHPYPTPTTPSASASASASTSTSTSISDSLSIQVPLSAQTYLLERAGLPPRNFNLLPISANPLMENEDIETVTLE